MTSFSFDVITNVWQNIEPFLVLESTIAAAQTCKDLHKIIIDGETRKVKVSHFTFISDGLYVPSFLPRALNYIHFPSLKSVQYPPEMRTLTALLRDGDDSNAELILIKEVLVMCFPLFVGNLYHARNLEQFSLNATSLVEAEYYGQPHKWVFDLLGRNLLNCCKLKDLRVTNRSDVEDDPEDVSGTFHSVALMHSLTPVVLKRKDELEALVFLIGGHPTERDYETRGGSHFVDPRRGRVYQEFFAAILSATKLISLDIGVDEEKGDSPFITNALLKAANDRLNASNAHPLKRLQRLRLEAQLGEDEDELDIMREEQGIDFHPIAPLFIYFSSCCSIRHLNVMIPWKFWEERDSAQVFKELFTNNPELKTVHCNFDGCDNRDSKVLNLLSDVATTSCARIVHFENVRGVNVLQLRNLVQYCESKGALLGHASCYSGGMRVDFRSCSEPWVTVVSASFSSLKNYDYHAIRRSHSRSKC